LIIANKRTDTGHATLGFIACLTGQTFIIIRSVQAVCCGTCVGGTSNIIIALGIIIFRFAMSVRKITFSDSAGSAGITGAIVIGTTFRHANFAVRVANQGTSLAISITAARISGTRNWNMNATGTDITAVNSPDVIVIAKSVLRDMLATR
jgi:nitrous oxidase accessory protein NosD